MNQWEEIYEISHNMYDFRLSIGWNIDQNKNWKEEYRKYIAEQFVKNKWGWKLNNAKRMKME